MNKKIIFIFTFVFFLTVGSEKKALAEEIVLAVEGNGSGSENELNVSSTTQTSVVQENTANIQNEIGQTATTGNNTADANAGSQTNIETGLIDAKTAVENSQINLNSADNLSQGQNLNLQITQNGSNSNNLINLSSQNNLTISQGNDAQIINNLNISANSGSNLAEANNGDVSIKTGNIIQSVTLKNKNLNKSLIIGGNCCFTDSETSINIKGNGAGSINLLGLILENNSSFTSFNQLDIFNNIFLDPVTGFNSVSNNQGDVGITTGDIVSIISLENKDLNESLILGGCPECPIVPPSENPPPEVPPVNNPGSAQPSNPQAPAGGITLEKEGQAFGGQVLGAVLPVTGSWWFFLATLISFMVFLMGWYLRSCSACSPPLAYNVR